MSRNIDFNKGIRGKHAHLNLRIAGAENDSAQKETVWGICLTEETETLIPRKLYKIKISENQAQVIDEKSEILICPKQWFAVLELPQTVSDLLKKVA